MLSELVNGLAVNRRRALSTLAGATAALAAVPASAQDERQPTVNPGGLDYNDPYDNLYAFGKIWSAYEEPVIGAFHGLMYGRVGDKRMVPIFGYTGTGVLLSKIAENGDLQIKSRETGYFTDLETGEILEQWENPWTGEVCDVYHFYNDVLIGRIGPEIPSFFMGANNDSPTLMNEGTVFPNEEGKYPFLLPFQQYGDELMLAWDYTHEYTNPVSPEGWPKSSTGPRISPSEHFTFQVNKDELEDRSLPTVRMTAGFSRVSQWWPFMNMGGTEFADGIMFGRMFSHKGLKGFGEVPRKMLDYIEKNAPEYLEMPDGDWTPRNDRVDTWKVYAKDIPPENPDYTGFKPDGFTPPTGKGSRV